MGQKTDDRIDLAFRLTLAILVILITLTVSGLLLEHLRGVI